jgi:antitoxin ParD1/3/4
MDITLSPKMQAFIDRKMRAGEYTSPAEVIEAGLANLEQQEQLGDFAPGELDALLAEGQADIDQGRVYNGAEVFRELDAMSAARRGAKKP